VRDAEGRAVPGARVALEAPDRVAATMFHLREMPSFLESEVIPTFPIAVQEAITDSYGRYTLSPWSEVAGGMYLTAESLDGALWASEVVRPSADAGADVERDLVLAPRERRTARLEIEFPGRVQATPVELAINGEPVDPGLVPLDQPLSLEALACGTWRLSGTWNGGELFPGPGYRELVVDGPTRTAVHLPDGAIYGQDAETLLRAKQP